MSEVTNEEIIDLIRKAQQTLPEEDQRPFVERAAERIGGVLSEHKNTLMGAGIGYLAGEVVEHIPVVGWFFGDYGGVAGALVGAWIGHARDEKERELRTKIGRVVGEELERAHSKK